MSRTRKGQKSVGLEWDRKREGKSGWRSPGKLAKRLAHKAEREEGKAEVTLSFCADDAEQLKAMVAEWLRKATRPA